MQVMNLFMGIPPLRTGKNYVNFTTIDGQLLTGKKW